MVRSLSGGSSAARHAEHSPPIRTRSRAPGQKHGPGQGPHHGASGGSYRQTRERHDAPRAPAALLQDARLRWQQPAGRTGAGHSHHTRTQRGER